MKDEPVSWTTGFALSIFCRTEPMTVSFRLAGRTLVSSLVMVLCFQGCLWLTLASATAAELAANLQSQEQGQALANKLPNVVLILADDLGWRDLACTGSTFYETPNLDRLAAKSMRFTQGYAACQVCSPSRAAIMTGKFPARMKTTDWFGAAAGVEWKRNTKLLPASYVAQLPLQDVTLAEAFRSSGYRTFFAGKWHLGGAGSFPEDHGFDVNIGGHHRGSPPSGFFSPYGNPKMTDGPAGESLPIRLGQETAGFIKQNSDRPFFAMLSFYSVHAPLQTSKSLWEKYREKAASLQQPDRRFIIDRTLQPVRQVQDHPLYAGMVQAMDEAVGLVLKQLEDSGLENHTIVVFTSDNGGVSAGDGVATSNLPLRGGKGRQWEGGIREPFFIWAPGFKQGECSTPVIATDLFPTLLDLTGLQLLSQQHVDGVSLRPLLERNKIADRDLYWHYPHYGNQGGEPSAIIRRGDLKLIYYFEDKRSELYDLNIDPSEMFDFANDRKAESDELRVALLNWLQEVEANMPTTNPNYDPEGWADEMEKLKTVRLMNLERQHAGFLDPKFQPNAKSENGGWWDQPSRSSSGVSGENSEK